MHRVLLAAITAAFFFSCASARSPRVATEEKPRRYEACKVNIIGGRELKTVGHVVGETFLQNTRVYLFVAADNPDDGRHIEQLTRIDRFCGAAKGQAGLRPIGADQRSPGDLP